ncbi:serine-rich adhesin for platelets [Nilaparvata lugens]|uniref:serine-rich adhesin for platelets n=1 Tax=Nilaparvata lugens TaxID=108931 RepID=UPI00193CF251|nr:serine-rich adhesin for platelets [Nilaparvata lugens]
MQTLWILLVCHRRTSPLRAATFAHWQMGCSNDFNIYGLKSILNFIMDLKNTQSLIVREPEDILPRLETTILDRKKQYVDKIEVLLASWEHVSTYLIGATPELIDKLISFIYRHTLHMILKVEWKRMNKAIKTHLMVTVTRCQRELDRRNINGLCIALCNNLISIMNDPWDIKTLTDIIQGNQHTYQEVQKYFTSENGVLIVMRIEALVDSKCEDFALRLADTCQLFLKTEKAKESNNNASMEEVNEQILATYQLDLIIDLYLTLLSRCGKNSDLKSVFQNYNLTEGVDLLRRFRNRKCGFGLSAKLWKNYKKIVEIGSCVFLTNAFLQPIEQIENCNILEALITEWLTFQNGSHLEDVIKKLVYSALSSQHIYTFCQVLIKHFGTTLKPFCIELFVIALTVNMNEVETQRDKNDKEKVKETEIQLANGYLLLADLFQDDVGISRECVLTAFSLNPTKSSLERIKSLAVACGKCTDKTPSDQQHPTCTDCSSQTDSKCSKCSSSSINASLPDNSTKKERTLDALIRIKGKSVTESTNYDVLSAPSQVLDAESLGLSVVLCNDLATVISSPRYQMLNWVLDWPELLSICESYLESNGEMKNQTKELKFLNIDYNIFKDWPEEVDSDMYCGIEKGYEQCIEPNDEYYVPPPIITKKIDSDSSESLMTGKPKKKRPRVTKNSTDVTQTKRKRKPRTVALKDEAVPLNVSDADTATQDSILNTDSLGSDGFQPNQVKTNLKAPRVVKRKAQRKPKKVQSQELTNAVNSQEQTNQVNQELTNESSICSIGSDFSNNEELLTSFVSTPNNISLLRKVTDPFVLNVKAPKAVKAPRKAKEVHSRELTNEVNGQQLTNESSIGSDLSNNDEFLTSFVSTPNNISLLKKVSDPFVLKTLRMFRRTPTHQVSPMTSDDPEPFFNMNNNFKPIENISRTLGNGQTPPIRPHFNNQKSKALPHTRLKSKFDDNFMQKNDENCLNGKNVSTDLITRDNLCKTVPGLNSLDMIIPNIMQPTVQIVQLPDNWNQANSSQSSEVVSSLQQTNSTTTSDQNKSNTSSSTSTNTGDAASADVQSGAAQSTSSSSSEQTQTINQSVPSAFTQVVSTAKASQTSNRQSRVSQTSMTATVTSSEPSHVHTAVSKPTTTMTSASVNTVNTGQYEPLSKNASPSNKSNSHQQTSVSSNLDPTKAKMLAMAKDSLSNKPSLRKQINRSIEGRILSIVESIKERKPNSTDDGKSATSSNESDIPRLIPCTKDSMTNSSGEVRSTNEVCIHVQASDIEFTNSKTVSIAKESLPKYSEDARGLSLANKPILRIQVPRLEHCLEGKLVNLNETAKDKKSNVSDEKNASSVTTPLQVFTSDRENQISKSRLLAIAKDLIPGNFVSEDSRNSSTPGKANFRLQVKSWKDLEGKPVNDTANQKSDSSEQVGCSQIASLPKFQQAFGKTMYQANSSSIATQSNPICDDGEVTEFSHTPGTSTSATPNVCTVLSKAVQTSNKETETKTIKSNQKNLHETNFKSDNLNLKLNQSMRTVQTVVSTNMQPTRIVTSHNKAHERPSVMQTTTSVIFPCKTNTTTVATGGIIHRKPVAILKTCTAAEKASQTKLDNETSSKETVIHSNINALLTAALQNSTCSSSETTAITTVTSGCISKQIEVEKKKMEMSVQTILPVANVHRVALPSSMQKNSRRQPVLTPTKYTRSVLQLTNISAQASTNTPPETTHRSVQSVLSPPPPTTANEPLIPHNTISETSVSSKTLEQLREFESVLEQVTSTGQMKDRSSTSQPLSVNLEPLLQIASSSSTTNFTNTSNSGSPTSFHSHAQSSKSTSVHDLHGERVSLTFIGQTPGLSAISDEKITSRTPIVLVQNCSGLLASPAASSSSASPASSINSTTAKLSIKTSKTVKSKTSSKTTTTTTTLKVSTLQKPQQKPQEDEQTTQRIYAILDKYAEQLRNSPELKNKPAPRRRSNPPTNPSPTSKRKKSTQTKSKMSSQQASCSSLSPGSEDLRTMGSEDSSNGVSQISQVLNSPQSRLDEPSTPTGGDISSETSESLDSKESRVQHRVVLTDSSVQNRAVIVQDNMQPTVINVEGAKVLTRKQVVVGGTTAMPLISLSNVPAGTVSTVRQVLFPVHSEGRLVVAKVPTYKYKIVPGSPLLTFQPMCVNKQNTNVKHMKNPVGITAQNLTGISTAQSAVVLPQDAKFTISSEGGLEGNISLDNTILINTTSASSISFLHHRSVQSNLLTSVAQDASTATSQPPRLVTAATATTSTSTSTTYQTNSNNLLSICTSNVNLMRQQTNEKRTVDKMLETDLSNDGLDTVQTTNDKSWSQKIGFRKRCVVVLIIVKLNSFYITDPKVQSKVVDELKCFILKKASPKHETDDNESSDSTSSGRAKQENQTNDRKTGESRAASETAWRYQPGSPKAPTNDDTENDPDADSNRRDNHASPSQIRRYQRTGSDVQNTIYQMAFRRSDRIRATRKPREPVDTRTVSSLDGELRLQKSLSEECEDLGVDEPSTSDLFPEAELLLDPGNSPLDPSSRDSCAQLPVFNRSFDDSCCSSSSSLPSSRSSPKRQRLSPSSATMDDSKQGASWQQQHDERPAVFTYSRTRVKPKTVSSVTKDADEVEDDDEDDKCIAATTTDEEMMSEGDFRNLRVLTPNGLATVQKTHVDNKSQTRNSCSSNSNSPNSCNQHNNQRRSSLRGHVKKDCSCCNGDSSQPLKRSSPPHDDTINLIKKR